MQKMYGTAAHYGYGLTYGQKPPFFSLPGYEIFFTELATLGGYLRSMNWNPLVDTTNTSTRTAWENWAKKNIVPQTYGLPGNQSEFNIINSTAYTYGIFNKTNGRSKRAGNVIPGGDPRFDHWLFPLWQEAPLATTATAVFLEPHQFVGTRLRTIDKILAGKVFYCTWNNARLTPLPHPLILLLTHTLSSIFGSG